METAVIAGATGLVGSHLLDQLLGDDRFGKVLILVRRPTGIVHHKLTEHLIDFSEPHTWKDLVCGDILFLCMGTTRAKAGGKRQQYEVDYTFQYRVASAAAANGLKTLVLVSAAGARLRSPFFYMRMKAELERDIRALPVQHTVIIRPGMLTGKRNENRPAENLGAGMLKLLNRLRIARKYRPIHAATVARAMVNGSFFKESGITMAESSEVFDLAG